MSTIQQRFGHYLRKAQGGVDILRQAERPSALPYYLVIGATTACPLHCIMCSRDAVINQANRMRLATFQRLLDEIRPIRVHVGDLGESLIDPDLVDKICEAKSRGINISLVTSYTVSRFTPEALINTGLDTLVISLDGAMAITHDAIRGQSYFETTTSHMHQAVQKAQSAGIQTNAALWTEARLQPYWQIYDGGQATPTQLQPS